MKCLALPLCYSQASISLGAGTKAVSTLQSPRRTIPESRAKTMGPDIGMVSAPCRPSVGNRANLFIAIFGVLASTFLYIHLYQANNIYPVDSDAYYHIKLAYLMRLGGN